MAESGCITNLKVSSLEVTNNFSFAGNAGFLTAVSTGNMAVDAATNTTKTATATITQPASTFIKNIFVRNAGAGNATIAAHADNAGTTLQVGIDGNTDSVLGPATAAGNTGNIMDGASEDDAQTWAAGAVGVIVSNGAPSGANAHTHINANLDSIAVVFQEANSYTAVSRDLVVTITTKSDSTNVACSAATWNVLFEFQNI